MAITRRSLLGNTAAGCAAAATAGFLQGCGFDVDAASEVSATADSNGKFTLSIDQAAPLKNIGGAVIVKVAATGSIAAGVPTGGILVARVDTINFVATAALCTHQGCPLGYSVADGQIACPCHGSRFSATVDPAKSSCGIGAVLRGPAAAPLRAFSTTFHPTARTVDVDLTSAPACGSPVFIPQVVNSKVELPFANIPELASVGGSWVGQPQGLADTLVVVRTSQTAASALSAVCTHQGCLVSYAAANNNLACPCHGSNYDLTGKVTQGPATTPVKQYAASVGASSVTVTVA